MKILFVNAGLESGGGLTHIVNLMIEAKKQKAPIELLVLSEGPVAQAARQAGIEPLVLGAKGRLDVMAFKRLAKVINDGNYDIVHTHGPRANLYLSLIHKKIKAKWCVTVHSDPFLDFAGRGTIGRIFTKLNLHALKKADCLFAITKRFYHLVVDQVGIPAERVHVIYNGIFYHDESQIPAKYSHEYFNVINVARTEKVKGQKLLLEAIKRLDDTSIRLHIVGNGSELENLEDYAKKLGLGPEVTFHGFLSQKKIMHMYRSMDLAVLSSYSESFPLVLLEASDNLVPILSTKVGDYEQMIPSSLYGFVAEVGDVDSLAEQLKIAANTPSEDLADMARREKEYLASHFSVAQQLADMMAVYRQLGEV
ncbi:glycosyltransferase [Lactobacillus corticis]|uniref:Glycosyl transferase n=1 Tax=Lactobacillus corticis TaxID=2201249 RepID=A0A916QHY8_9LACO|nr:glycosyltransferase [Lactobacillus corticis]GFZ26347.1 glycosyl transferase [Lactobacillus corticis]